jgi:hypothetical protein
MGVVLGNNDITKNVIAFHVLKLHLLFSLLHEEPGAPACRTNACLWG